MKTLRAVSVYVVMIASLLVFATAFADASAAASAQMPPDTVAMLWLVVGMSAATVWGAAARYLTGRFNFFHNVVGHTIIALVGGVVGAVAPVVEHGWNSSAVLVAALGAVVAFLGGANPGTAGQVAAQKSAVTGPGPTITKAGMILLPILFLFSISGCSAAYNVAFKQCIAKSGITNASTIEAQVFGVLGNAVDAGSVVAALENVATAALPVLGKDAYVAVECAINSWKTANPLPKAMSSPNPHLLIAHQGANEWIFRHFAPPQSSISHVTL